MKLKTKRLILTPFTESDLASLFSLLKDPVVMRFSLAGPLETIEKASDYLKRIMKHYEAHGFGLNAIRLKDSKEFIGLAGITHQVIDGETKPEIGYRLLPQFWGMNYAFEAAEAVLDYGFHTLQLTEIIAIIEPANEKSERLARRLGMALVKKTEFYGRPVHIFALHKERK